VFVLLAVVGAIFLFDGPTEGSPAKMAAWYGSSSNRMHVNVGWILTGLGLFALIWFVSALRERLQEEDDSLLSTIVLVGGTVYVALAMAGIAVAGGTKTMSDDTYHHQVYSGVIHAANDVSYVLVVTGGAAMAALIFATAIAVRRYAILPGWLGWFGFVAGVAAIFSVVFFTMLIWLLWVAVASVSLFLGARPATERRREPSPATS
jgi:membrane protein implicated in regulation of membrane protease activity